MSSAKRSCRHAAPRVPLWSSKLQKVRSKAVLKYYNPVTRSSLDRFSSRELTTCSKWLQKWIDTTYLGAFDQTFFLNRVYWDSFTRESDLDAQLAPMVGKKWCTPGDHGEGADGVHQNGRYKVPKRMPRSRSNCFFHVFFHYFGAKMSLCCKAACIYVMFSLRKASRCWSSAFLINPPDIRQKLLGMIWYDILNHVSQMIIFVFFMIIRYYPNNLRGASWKNNWLPSPTLPTQKWGLDKALSLREMEVDSPLLRPCFQGMNVRGSVDRPFKHGCGFPFCDSFLYLTFPFTAPFFTWLLLLQLLSLLDCSFSVFLLYFTVPSLFFTFWKFLNYTSFDDD